VPSTKTDDLKYQTKTVPAGTSTDLFTVKVRYKAPAGDTSKMVSRAVTSEQRAIADTSVDFRWAAAVAGLGMLLRESPHRGTLSWQQVQSLAEGAIGADAEATAARRYADHEGEQATDATVGGAAEHHADDEDHRRCCDGDPPDVE
jgi:hypothetical protein